MKAFTLQLLIIHLLINGVLFCGNVVSEKNKGRLFKEEKKSFMVKKHLESFFFSVAQLRSDFFPCCNVKDMGEIGDH